MCMSERPRREDGTFESTVSRQAILKVFSRTDEPVLTATEIADELDTTNVTVTRYLKEMKGDNLVDRKKTGANAVAWWVKVEPRPNADDEVENLKASDFRGMIETDKTAAELVDEALEEDREREERLMDVASDE